MEGVSRESVPGNVCIRQATDDDCVLMFRVQHLDGAVWDCDNKEVVQRYEKYKEEYNPDVVEVIEYEGESVGRLRIVRDEDMCIGGLQLLPTYWD